MKNIKIIWAALALAAAPCGAALAQVATPAPMGGAPAEPVPGAIVRPAQEVDQLVGPIALYPDPLIAEILPAATQPGEINAANAYLRAGNDPGSVDSQPWDASVKALARYPDLLRWMSDNIVWTSQLGQAFLYQPADVMNSVQRLRAQAQSLGNLVSTPQQQVVVSNQIIEIVPANPEVIYVPVYTPAYVYYRRPVPGRFWVTFGAGFHVGLWLSHDCDWHNHSVIVWHPDHPRPRDWWYRPPVERFHPGPTVVVNVWHPRPVPAHLESHEIHEMHGGGGRPVIVNRPTVIERPQVPSRPPGGVISARPSAPARDYHRGAPSHGAPEPRGERGEHDHH